MQLIFFLTYKEIYSIEVNIAVIHTLNNASHLYFIVPRNITFEKGKTIVQHPWEWNNLNNSVVPPYLWIGNKFNDIYIINVWIRITPFWYVWFRSKVSKVLTRQLCCMHPDCRRILNIGMVSKCTFILIVTTWVTK